MSALQEASAKLRYARISPQKARLVARELKGLLVTDALNLLKFSPKKAAGLLKKVVESARANAENNFGLDIDLLSVGNVLVDVAPSLKRVSYRAKGRTNKIVKRNSHITVILSAG